MKLRTTPDGKLYVADNGFLPKTLSVSAINCYKNCPRDYYYKYVLGVWPEQWRPSFAIGHVIHEVIENYYTVGDDDEHLKTVLLDSAGNEGLFDPENIDPDKAQKEIDMAWKMIEDAKKYLQQWKPKYVEHEFKTLIKNPARPQEVIPIPFVGYMDLVTVDDIIVDHKTGASLRKEDELKRDIQVYIYMMAFRSLFNRPPRELVYNTLLKRKRDSVTSIVSFKPDETMEAVVFEEIKSVLNGMQLGYWKSKKSMWCDTCRNFPERRKR